MHFQGCLRVPLSIHAPGRLPARTRSLVSSVDLAQTVLDLCGVAAYQGMQGYSLRTILDDPTAVVRQTALVEDDFPPVEGRGQLMPFKTRTVLSDLGRYTRYSNGHEQLFDLAADPDELVDLTEHDRDPVRRAQMTSELADALIAADDVCRREPVSP